MPVENRPGDPAILKVIEAYCVSNKGIAHTRKYFCRCYGTCVQCMKVNYWKFICSHVEIEDCFVTYFDCITTLRHYTTELLSRAGVS